MTERILLIGAGGHARSCIDVIETAGRFAIAGLVGTRGEVGQRVLAYEIVGTDDEFERLRSLAGAALVAIGQIRDPEPRIRAFELAHRAGFRLPPIVSTRAHLSRHAAIGAGTAVMHGAVVNVGAVIGKNCIINSQALVEHDAIIGDHCHVSTGARVNGGARVGAGSFIGSGAVLREGVEVAPRSFIHMGELVLRG